MRATESARSKIARNFYRLFNESGYSINEFFSRRRVVASAGRKDREGIFNAPQKCADAPHKAVPRVFRGRREKIVATVICKYQCIIFALEQSIFFKNFVKML